MYERASRLLHRRHLGQALQTPDAKPQEKPAARGILMEALEVAVLAAILYFVIQFVVQTVHVIGFSMYPTVSDGDYLIATKIDYRLHAPQRGDVIIMQDPYNANTEFIKRVIGVPGDHILIRAGHTYVNGHLLAEPYINPAEPWTVNGDYPVGVTNDPNGFVLGKDDYFVMGDNRNHSTDSRMFNAIRRDQIEAHAWIRVWPFTEIGLVGANKATLTTQALAPA